MKIVQYNLQHFLEQYMKILMKNKKVKMLDVLKKDIVIVIVNNIFMLEILMI